MKIFKNGIEANWVLVAIGFISLVGLSYAATPPIISDQTSIFGGVNITRLNSTGAVNGTVFGDADNLAYYIDPANTGTSGVFAGNVSIRAGTGTGLLLGTDLASGQSNTAVRFGDTAVAWWDINFTQNAAGGSNRLIYEWNDGAIFTLLGNGNGGIGTPNPSYKFEVAGTMAVTGVSTTSGTDDIGCIDPTTKELTKNTGSATTCAASSEKVKHSINTKPQDINLNKVRPVNFVYNNDKSERVRTGFIAEEFCIYYPEACYTGYQGNGTFVKVVVNPITNKADGFLYSDGVISPVKGVEPDYFVPTLTQVIQEQQFLIETQAAQIRNICTNAPQLCS